MRKWPNTDCNALIISSSVPSLGPGCQPEQFLMSWGLVTDGEPIRTHSSDLFPVVRSGLPMMLKIARSGEEKRGNALLEWWSGEGAARVFEHEGDAVLMERAPKGSELTQSIDAVAIPIFYRVIKTLHSKRRSRPVPPLEQLHDRFAPLLGTDELRWRPASEAARQLLFPGADQVVLHGDIHHGNVLKFDDDWKAIDPKGVIGPPGFDYANIFANPLPTPLEPERFRSRLEQVSNLSGISQHEIVSWVLAWSGLAGIWNMESGDAEAAHRSEKLSVIALEARNALAL